VRKNEQVCCPLAEPRKKIALAIIGHPKVGKTEIIRLLRKNSESQGLITKLKSSNSEFIFWEHQTSSVEPQRLEIFSRSFLQNSEPFHRYLLIVTDSKRESIDQVKYSLGFLRESFPDTRFAIVANKQDLEGSLGKSRIEKTTRYPTLAITATDPKNRPRLVNFLSYLVGFDVGL
jgi:signal recognition particle receptor subunit beta